MIELYSLNYITRITISTICFIAMLLETILVILKIQNDNKNIVDVFYGISLVLYFFSSTFIISIVQREIDSRLFISSIDFFRYSAFISIVLLLYKFIRKPKLQYLVVLLLLTPTIPLFDKFTGKYYPIIFVTVNCLMFLFSVQKSISEWNNINNNLSTLSIKQALDTIHDGLLFSNSKGRVLLINNSMMNLLKLCNISPSLNIHKIYESIKKIEKNEYCEVINTEDKILIRFLNNKTYLISLNSFKYNKLDYWQLFAADITQEDLLTKELKNYALNLNKTQKSILHALNNIKEIESSKELLRLKSSVHDIIGQRLSIIHRFLEDMSGSPVTTTVIKELFSNLDEELNMAFAATSSETLEKIQKLFSIIGVSVKLSGNLPEDLKTQNILLQIIREASTNAVKHGNAKEINIETYTENKRFFMIISNDGSAAKAFVKEGNGIKGMREKIEKIGGNFHYEITPKFRLHISI